MIGTGPNPLAPSRMTPAERRGELCAILALGLIRLYTRDQEDQTKSRELSARARDCSLDCPRHRSGHATPTQERTA